MSKKHHIKFRIGDTALYIYFGEGHQIFTFDENDLTQEQQAQRVRGTDQRPLDVEWQLGQDDE